MRKQGDAMRRLAWTLGGVAAAVAPHVAHLQAWVTAAALSVCAWRLMAERRGWALPGRALRGGITLAAAAGIFIGY